MRKRQWPYLESIFFKFTTKLGYIIALNTSNKGKKIKKINMVCLGAPTFSSIGVVKSSPTRIFNLSCCNTYRDICHVGMAYRNQVMKVVVLGSA